MSISEVKELPTTEIDMWALVFKEEQDELNKEQGRSRPKRKAPENRSPEEQIARFKRIMAPKRKRG